MNVFLHELKAGRKATIIWSLVMAAFLYLSMVKFTALSSDAAASQQLMKAFPATIQAVFGMVGLDLTTITGYYGICFIFIAVMLAIHAGMLGANLVAKEEVDKTVEFLCVKPIGRVTALTVKLLAGLVIITIVAAITYSASAGSIAAVNQGSVPYRELGLFTAALAVIQLTFYSIGLGAAAALKVPKKATTIVATLVFSCYFAYVLQGLSSNFSWAKNLSPFAYFSAQDILSSLSINGGYVLICAAISALAIAAAYLGYARRDFTI